MNVRKRILQFSLAVYAAGIAVTPAVQLDAFSVFMLFLLALLAALVNEAAAWKKSWVYIFLALFLLGITMSLWQAETNRGNLEPLAGQKTILRGTIVQEPDVRPNTVNYTVRVEEEGSGILQRAPKGLILLGVRGAKKGFSFGDKIEIRGTPVIPEEPGNPGEFNYKKYLGQKGIGLIVRSIGGAGVHKVGTGRVNPLIGAALGVKEKCIFILNQSLSSQNAAIMEGMLFGSVGRIDAGIRNDFALTGVVHILSVSGYHMALLVGAALFLSRALGLGRLGSGCLTITVTAAYALMSGGSPPVIRALVMAWILLLARAAGRKHDWCAALSGAAFLILLEDPFTLYQPGFQLSFGATWGIFYITPLLEEFLPFKMGLNNALAGTIAAQLGVIPLMAYYFNYIPLISVVANLIVVPLTSFAMLTGSLAVISGFIWLPLAGILNVSTDLLMNRILGLNHLLAGVPFAGIIIKQPSVPAISLYFFLLVIILLSTRNREISIRLRRLWLLNRTACVLTGMSVIAVLLWAGILFPGTRQLEVAFIDIGQGDAVLIKSPVGRNLLIDTGGAQGPQSSYDPGEKILVPYLKRLGITRVDVLVLSHPHADHIQGAAALAKYAKIRLLAVSPSFVKYREGAEMAKLIKSTGTEIREIAGGERLTLDENIYIDIISPVKGRITDENNDSLVMKLSYHDFSILFTGDAEQPALEQILQNNPELRAEIVKVPHHGSRNAWVEPFYRNLKTSLAIISVGAHNYFGHPSKEVLAGLAGLRIPVLRTDQAGAVIIKSDGYTYNITTGKGME